MSKQFHVKYRITKDDERRFHAECMWNSFEGIFYDLYWKTNTFQPKIFSDINQAHRVARGYEFHWLHNARVEMQAYVDEV